MSRVSQEGRGFAPTAGHNLSLQKERTGTHQGPEGRPALPFHTALSLLESSLTDKGVEQKGWGKTSCWFMRKQTHAQLVFLEQPKSTWQGMVLPTVGWTQLLIIKTISCRHAHRPVYSRLRLSFQMTLGCIKSTVKANQSRGTKPRESLG